MLTTFCFVPKLKQVLQTESEFWKFAAMQLIDLFVEVRSYAITYEKWKLQNSVILAGILSVQVKLKTYESEQMKRTYVNKGNKTYIMYIFCFLCKRPRPLLVPCISHVGTKCVRMSAIATTAYKSVINRRVTSLFVYPSFGYICLPLVWPYLSDYVI